LVGGHAVAGGGGAAAVANWLAIAIAASISRGAQVSPVDPARISEAGAACGADVPACGASSPLAGAGGMPAASSYGSLATEAAPALTVASGAGATDRDGKAMTSAPL
jgi:hypothetical protein